MRRTLSVTVVPLKPVMRKRPCVIGHGALRSAGDGDLRGADRLVGAGDHHSSGDGVVLCASGTRGADDGERGECTGEESAREAQATHPPVW